MNAVTRSLVSAQLLVTAHVTGLVERVSSSDRGQASAEYAGIIFVIVAIIAAVVGAADGWGNTLVQKITEQIDSIGA
ncbi:hypothetical protein [Quadrisphaera sp. INWT6]|uniref:hypothetical protein n=1 Tax=Quadrisphaera sp. INWT6 TaxID=2596917 RepID=UPI001891FBEA|nr:hypothetical protein [Quadrisphaera sp. INWT6]MBF5080233.1 hypothetical protein [Quadrisphaera sp. INWT6]